MRRSNGRVLWAVAASTLVAAALAMGAPPPAGADPAAPGPALRPLLLAAADVPQGWTELAAQKSTTTTRLGCVAKFAHPGKGWRHADAVFSNGKGLPFVTDAVASGPGVAKTWRRLRAELSGCRSATITIKGKAHRARIRPLAFASAATGAVASRWQLTATGLALGVDLFVFRVRQVLGVVAYVDAGVVDTTDASAFAAAAVARAGGRAGVVDGVVTVATAPVRTVRTADGVVAYRKVGSGPPLVLVMGYGGTMETWDPQFVDALAHHYTVVVFDNAGIGRTPALPGTLTIDAMAQQTSALVAALHLGSPDVLGWSMGGLVAEALAVLHPAQVHRLVLCATYPGTGAVRPPQSAVDDLDAGGTKALGVLFPPGAEAAATLFTVATAAYPTAAPAPPRVVTAQGDAVLEAWSGKDPALRRFRDIRAPTLVADGAEDRLVPAANARALAAGIAGSTLLIDQGAGHAFLFQDLVTFVPAVEEFLAH
jgi:pimeloyl-ACP methyl ester carboxylesterase